MKSFRNPSVKLLQTFNPLFKTISSKLTNALVLIKKHYYYTLYMFYNRSDIY